MAGFSGKTGAITGPTINVNLTSMEIDHKGEAVDVTGMSDSGLKKFVAGLTEFSGSFEGHATGDVTALQPGLSTATWVFSTGSTGAPKLTCTYSAGITYVIITGCKVSSSVEGSVKCSVTFQGSGTLTYGTV
jgi:hypothetical protein